MLSLVEASNHEPFDKALLSKVEGLRANGNLVNEQSRIITITLNSAITHSVILGVAKNPETRPDCTGFFATPRMTRCDFI